MPDRPGMPAAILFDCDGTLLLTGEVHFTAISAALRRQGQVMERGWYAGLTGLGRQDLFRRYCADFGLRLDAERLVSESIGLTVEMAGQARENPLVASLARRAAGRLPVAVVTNSETAVVRAFLGATGMLGLFDRVLGCEDAPRPKPAPDLYLAAAEVLQVPCGGCLVLEDSDQGIAAAAAAGMAWHDVRRAPWPAACADLMGWLDGLPTGQGSAGHQPVVRRPGR